MACALVWRARAWGSGVSSDDAPGAPGVPSAPFGPAGPAGPASPFGPVGPAVAAGSTPRARSAFATEPFLISDDRTAPARISRAPTLSFASFTAAYDVPPSARKTAMVAMTLA